MQTQMRSAFWKRIHNRANKIFRLQLIGHQKKSVPIFAPDLGLLEPTRGSAESGVPEGKSASKAELTNVTSAPPGQNAGAQPPPPPAAVTGSVQSSASTPQVLTVFPSAD